MPSEKYFSCIKGAIQNVSYYYQHILKFWTSHLKPVSYLVLLNQTYLLSDCPRKIMKNISNFVGIGQIQGGVGGGDPGVQTPSPLFFWAIKLDWPKGDSVLHPGVAQTGQHLHPGGTVLFCSYNMFAGKTDTSKNSGGGGAPPFQKFWIHPWYISSDLVLPKSWLH